MPVHSIKNKILTAFKNAIESKLDPELKTAAEPIIISGMKILYSDSTHPKVLEVYDQMKQQGFKPAVIANGVVGLMGMIFQASKGQMSIDAAYPAAVILACYVMEDIESMGFQVTQESVKAVVALLGQKLFDVLGQEQGGAPEAQPGEQAAPSAQSPQAQPGMAAQPGMVM